MEKPEAIEHYKEAWTLLRRLEDENSTVGNHLVALRSHLTKIRDDVDLDELDVDDLELKIITPLQTSLRELSEIEQRILEVRLRHVDEDD